MSQTARARTASTLVVLAAIGLLATLVTGYAVQALFDSGEFSDRAASTLQEDAVTDEIGAGDRLGLMSRPALSE